MASYSLFCDPAFGQTLRTDCVTGNNVGTIGGSCSAIFGGVPSGSPTNVNNADLSVILMGDTNVINTFSGLANGMYNHIGNGCGNTAAGYFVNIFNGQGNTAKGCFVEVGNGCLNSVDQLGGVDSCYVAVGNGYANAACGSFTTVVNGCSNCASGSFLFMGAGYFNCIDSNAGIISTASIVGGHGNIICDSGSNSFIGGGGDNLIIDSTSSIVGGENNKVCTACAFIGGGETNFILPNASRSVIGGGAQNTIDGFPGGPASDSFIGGGRSNLMCIGTTCAVITGGYCNLMPVANSMSFIGGGACNSLGTALGHAINYGVIGGGCNNIVCGSSDAAVIFGGAGNLLFGCGAFIGGGVGNVINTTVPLPTGLNYSTIVGGYQNQISNTATLSFIGGGSLNIVESSDSFIGTGGSNQIISGDLSSIVNGDTNRIANGSNYTFIGGGNLNHIGNPAAPTYADATYGIIGTGSHNCIDTGFGISSALNIIGNGSYNTICAGSNCSGIVTGDTNILSGNHSILGGGLNNGIGNIGAPSPGADFSFLGGGSANCIDTGGAPGATTYGTIGGGESNTIHAGTNHSSIFGGSNNQVSGNCSAILGGINNNDGGYPYTGIFGVGVTGLPLAAGNGGFFVNELVIQNIPVITALTYSSLQAGELYTDTPPGLGYKMSRVYIK